MPSGCAVQRWAQAAEAGLARSSEIRSKTFPVLMALQELSTPGCASCCPGCPRCARFAHHHLPFAESPSTCTLRSILGIALLAPPFGRAMMRTPAMHAQALSAAHLSAQKAPCPHLLRHDISVPRPRMVSHRMRERLLSCQAASSRESSGSDFDSKAEAFGRAAGKRWDATC